MLPSSGQIDATHFYAPRVTSWFKIEPSVVWRNRLNIISWINASHTCYRSSAEIVILFLAISNNNNFILRMVVIKLYPLHHRQNWLGYIQYPCHVIIKPVMLHNSVSSSWRCLLNILMTKRWHVFTWERDAELLGV